MVLYGIIQKILVVLLHRGPHLVRVVDAGEALDLAGARRLVKTLGVAVLAHGEGDLHIDLDEPVAAPGAHRVVGVQVDTCKNLKTIYITL